MVFYRKYRPQKLEELDITGVREKLSSIVKSGDIPHAFLFAGPKGLGKTSAARILTKAISCEEKLKKRIKNQKGEILEKKTIEQSNNETIEPCNSCEACITITNGSNLDVIEIDAASNRGIDEIRELREKIKFTPLALVRKVYIIDEVHMLTTEAFNALLKTLEEPPSHALFILCTTEPWKLPETILSRTFFVQFEKPTPQEFLRSIGRIVKAENLQMDNDVFDEIFDLSSGSFRDGAKIIEELSMASKDKRITKELLETSYKTHSIENEIYVLLVSLESKKTKEALLVVDRLACKGMDFKVVTEKIVGYLHNMLLKRAGLSTIRQEVNKDIKDLDVYQLEKLIEYFSAAYKELKFSVLSQLPLEMAIIKWCEIDVGDQRSKIKDQKETEKREDKSDKDTKTVTQKENTNLPDSNKTNNGQDLLKELIDRIKVDSQTVAGVLRSCRLQIKDTEITIIAPSKFHNDKLSDVKIKEIVAKRAGEIMGKKIELTVQMKK